MTEWKQVSIPYRLATNSYNRGIEDSDVSVSIPYRLATNRETKEGDE